MLNIQTIIYLVIVSTTLTINCNARQYNNDDSNFYDDRRDLIDTYLDRYVDKRSAKSVCTGSAQCGNICDPKKQYDSSTTCGLVCYAANWEEKVGSKGTCQLNSKVCGGQSSTFCPGGSYTSIRNDYPNNPNYFDCNNGYGCADKGGCCVRIAGATNNNWQYYCLKCNQN
ncbi:unnamed protein product [Adineta ricciae]|uniref:Secreted protein n=1 Tax=Adineta ricciae TaxID=249248 RepID=A0A815JN11_ADIRI|nr:unnamed protein product [Adineta ricciae]CAF1520979.1 unnamed protein product [Adineta ricciae]